MLTRAHAFARPRDTQGPKLLLIALLLLIGVGAGLGARRQLTTISDTNRAVLARQRREALELTAEVKRLTQEADRRMAAAMAAAEAAPPAPITPAESRTQRVDALLQLAQLHNPGGRPGLGMRALVPAVDDLVKRGLGTPPAFLVSDEGILPAGFGDLFGLDPSAVARLQENMLALKERGEAAIVRNCAILEREDGRIVLRSDPVPEAAAWRDEFNGLLRSALGAEGARALVLLNQRDGGGLDTLFGGLSPEPRTITVIRERSADGRSAGLRYTIKKASGPTSTASIGPEADLGRILKTRLGAIAALLPPEFL